MRCFESLEKCIGADKTEVYVALDYPPTDKYRSGWLSINEYLNFKEKQNRFNKLHVIRRDFNYGICRKHGNLESLLSEVILKNYDSFILTEDDNYFSLNFLIYINQGLKKFENDNNCFAICGYNYYGLSLNNSNNIYLSREFSAWGVGCWTKKWSAYSEHISVDYAKYIFSSWKNVWTIFKHEPRLLNTVMLNIASNRAFGDTMIVCTQYLENMYSVFPLVSKVRNLGFDGSGTSIFQIDHIHENQVIDSKDSFVMDDIEREVNEKTQREVERYFRRSKPMTFLIFVRVLIYYLFKIDILYFEQKRRNKSLFVSI